MKKIILASFLLIGFSALLLNYLKADAHVLDDTIHSKPEETLTKPEMLADYKILRDALEEVHGGLYRFVKKERLDRIFDDYEAEIDGSKTKLEFIALLSRMLTEVRDGHMRLEFDDKTNSDLSNALRFPFGIGIDNGKLRVIFNDSTDDKLIIPGTEIVSINGNRADAVLNKILDKISGDGFIQTGKLRRAAAAFDSYYWLFVDDSPRFKIDARNANGEPISVEVNGIKRNERKLNRQSNPLNTEVLKHTPFPGSQTDIFSVRFFEKDAVAYLGIRGFQGGDFISKLDSHIQMINAKRSSSLILDLRGNGGGVDIYGANLVSRFTDKPFRYFEKIHLRSINPSFSGWKSDTYQNLKNGTTSDGSSGFLVSGSLHNGLNLQEPSASPFMGKLFVLIDGGTFSTAADVSALLRSLKRATFIGEETGGTYSGNTSGLNAKIDLPNSKNSVKIHMYGYWNAVTPPAETGRGIIPDLPITTNTKDLIEGKDEQLKLALKLSGDQANK
ncbi:MAG: S41 family peptidase [Pyrinomonadaceae bacterium]